VLKLPGLGSAEWLPLVPHGLLYKPLFRLAVEFLEFNAVIVEPDFGVLDVLHEGGALLFRPKLEDTSRITRLVVDVRRLHVFLDHVLDVDPGCFRILYPINLLDALAGFLVVLN